MKKYYVDEWMGSELAGSNYGSFDTLREACLSIRNNRIDPRLRTFVVCVTKTGKISRKFSEMMEALTIEREQYLEDKRYEEEEKHFERKNRGWV